MLPLGCDSGWGSLITSVSGTGLCSATAKSFCPPVSGVQNQSTFLHDSLHTDDHMQVEFCAVWPFVSAGGSTL